MNEFDFDADIQTRLSSTSHGLAPKEHRLDQVQALGRRRQARQRVAVSTAAIVAFLGLGGVAGTMTGLFEQNQVIESADGGEAVADDGQPEGDVTVPEDDDNAVAETPVDDSEFPTTTGPPEVDDGLPEESAASNPATTSIEADDFEDQSQGTSTDTAGLDETQSSEVPPSTGTTLASTTVPSVDDGRTATTLSTTTMLATTADVPTTMGPPAGAIVLTTGRPGATFSQWNTGLSQGAVPGQECYQYNADVMYEACVRSVSDQAGVPFIVDRSNTPGVLVILAMLPPLDVREVWVEDANGVTTAGAVAGDSWIVDVPVSAQPVLISYVDVNGILRQEPLPSDAANTIADRILIGRAVVLG